MVASDVTALVTYTRDVIYLNDGEMAILTPSKVELRTLANVPVQRQASQVSWEISADGKGSYDHYMLKEIYEQPESVENSIRGRLNFKAANAVLSGLNLTPREMAQINRIVVAACGSSFHAGLVGSYYFEDIAGIQRPSNRPPNSATATRSSSRTPWSCRSASPARPPTHWPPSAKP